MQLSASEVFEKRDARNGAQIKPYSDADVGKVSTHQLIKDKATLGEVCSSNEMLESRDGMVDGRGTSFVFALAHGYDRVYHSGVEPDFVPRFPTVSNLVVGELTPLSVKATLETTP